MLALTRGRVAATLVVLCMALAGCESMNDLLKSAPKPTARVTGASLKGLTLEKVDLVFDVDIANPYDVSLPLTELGYSVSSGGQKLFEGSVQPSGAIPARGSKVIQVPASLKFSSVMAALKGVRPGSVVPYRADFNFGIDAPVVGRMNLPLSHSGEVPIPAVPDVTVTAFDVDSLTFDKVQATAKLNVKNTNQFALDLSKLGLNLSLGGKEVSRTQLAQSASLGPGQTASVEVPLSFSPRAFGAGMLNLLSGGDASYAISGSLEAGTRFGPLSLPFSHKGNTNIVK
jgi:LEA14-like dessication related protein